MSSKMIQFVHCMPLLDNLISLVYRSSCSIEKIVGGKAVSNEEFPYQLSLRYNDQPLCGAALISPDTALTAAHCIPKHGVYSVRAGSTYVDKGGVISYVRTAIIHPGFNPDTEDYDLAILKLTPPLKLSNKIRPVRLPSEDEAPPTNLKGYASGWGTLSSFYTFMPEGLRAVELPILGRDVCTAAYRHLTGITPRMFCAGYREGGRDSCQGDSGGPFVVNGTLYGLVSWGFNCGEPGYPGVYTNVSVLRNFIKINANV